ncbi:MAG: MotA/TolQ/ExbB proton channel family protein [Phycisphaerae bacterium]
MKFLIQPLADLWIFVVVALAMVNLAMFLVLRRWTRRGPARLVNYLEDILGTYRRTNADVDRTVHEQIDCFVQDIREVIGDTSRQDDRRELCRRLLTKDEAKSYLKRDHSEWLYSVSRTLVEVHPLNGILGTVLAIAASMSAAGGTEATSANIVSNFANATSTTLVGLLAGVVFMIWHASMTPAVERHYQHLGEVRQIVQTARMALMHQQAGES